jgi:hypothetical protein
MPDDLYMKIKLIADKESRSYNQEAVYILKKFVEDYEKENGPIHIDTNVLYE